jgi:RHS repeat-associated protein
MANAVIERYVLDDVHNGLSSADGGNVVLDFVDPDGSGAQAMSLTKRYLYGEAVDQILAQEDLSKTLGDAARNLWPLVDHLSTVRDLAKQDGTIAAHYKYDSFGNVTSGDTSKTRYLFTSREFDTATKLQYNRARYYDAAVGRWISEDPLGFAAGDANVGRYVGNEVTRATDPSGLKEFKIKIYYRFPSLPVDDAVKKEVDRILIGAFQPATKEHQLVVELIPEKDKDKFGKIKVGVTKEGIVAKIEENPGLDKWGKVGSGARPYDGELGPKTVREEAKENHLNLQKVIGGAIVHEAIFHGIHGHLLPLISEAHIHERGYVDAKIPKLDGKETLSPEAAEELIERMGARK